MWSRFTKWTGLASTDAEQKRSRVQSTTFKLQCGLLTGAAAVAIINPASWKALGIGTAGALIDKLTGWVGIPLPSAYTPHIKGVIELYAGYLLITDTSTYPAIALATLGMYFERLAAGFYESNMRDPETARVIAENYSFITKFSNIFDKVTDPVINKAVETMRVTPAPTPRKS